MGGENGSLGQSCDTAIKQLRSGIKYRLGLLEGKITLGWGRGRRGWLWGGVVQHTGQAGRSVLVSHSTA